MKKKILSAMIVLSLAASLSACSGNEPAATTTAPAAATTTTPAPETTTTEAEVTDEAPADTPDEGGSDGEEEPESVLFISDELDESGLNECQKLVVQMTRIPSVKDYSTLLVVDDEMVGQVMSYDTANFSEYGAAMNMMSAHLIEIIIGKPADGKKQAALDMLEQRKDYYVNNFMGYPDQLPNAESTIVGSKGDYVYLFCTNDSAEMEAEFTKAIGG